MKKVILTILDGFGIRDEIKGNAIKNANTKAIDKLVKEFPNSKLKASGEEVGLPSGQMGNSEVGHITIGSGRIIDQPLLKINKVIKNKTFYRNKEIKKAINHAKENSSKLHILGLLSDGGVHSHIDHIFALLKMAKTAGIKEVYIHAFLDGRDVAYNSAETYLEALEKYIKKNQIGTIATISGRYYAMDREKVWSRTQKAYNALINEETPINKNYKAVIEEHYKQGIYDEFIRPTVIDEKGKIKDNDSIIVANFRPDRIPQIITAIIDSNFSYFKTKKLNNVHLLTMMSVSDDINVPFAFPHDSVDNTIGEVLSNESYRVLRIAETSKYPHVTHFIDGDRDIELKYTTKIMVPRQKVDTYDKKPEMSANEVTDKIKYLIEDYDFIIVNYANGDMVGHTGNYKAAITAVETLDKCIRDLYELAFKNDILLIITADHGNCEEMIREDGKPHTYHTTNMVPFIICDKEYKVKDGKLSDIAPSILSILNIEIPKEMTGNIIVEKKESENEKSKRKISFSTKYSNQRRTKI